MASNVDELRHLREFRRINQRELAMRPGTTLRHVSLIERWPLDARTGMVVRPAQTLELSLRDHKTRLVAAGYAPLFAEPQLDAPGPQGPR